MVIFHDHSDIKSRAAPPGQRRIIYSRYFLEVITSCHSASPSSSAPISVPSFQSNPGLFSSLYQGGARIGHLQTRMNESGPAHFRAVYRSGLVVIVREWERRNMRDPEMRILRSEHHSPLVGFSPSALSSVEPSVRSRCEIAHAYHLWWIYSSLFFRRAAREVVALRNVWWVASSNSYVPPT